MGLLCDQPPPLVVITFALYQSASATLAGASVTGFRTQAGLGYEGINEGEVDHEFDNAFRRQPDAVGG